MDAIPLRTPSDLGAQVRRLRRNSGLTQAALAESAGVSRRLVVDMEGGKPRLELIGVMAVLEALEVDLGLLPAVDDGPPPAATEVPW